MLPSAIAYQKHGIKQSVVSYMMQEIPAIPNHLRDVFSNYFLLYWKGSYILKKMKSGIIIREDTPYHVCFSKSLTRGKILNNPNAQYAISFRKAKPEYQIPAYCIISEA